ncbi:MAG: hypothetical protein Q9166_007502 [cf. Caloplaca sp. 2 TL-2023]
MEQRTGMSFVSGLCKESLYTELIWKVDNTHKTSRSTLCQTWSWASVEGADITSVYNFLMYSKNSIFHILVEPVDDSCGVNTPHQQGGLHVRGPLLHVTLERNKYGDFRTDSSRRQEFGYNSDIPLPDTVEVICLLIVEWDEDYDAEDYQPDLVPPEYAGLIFVPRLGEASMYERVGVWSDTSHTGLGPVEVTPADWQPLRLV